MALFASGKSFTEIAEERGNSTVTIRNTLYRIQDKLGIGTKQELPKQEAAGNPGEGRRRGAALIKSARPHS